MAGIFLVRSRQMHTDCREALASGQRCFERKRGERCLVGLPTRPSFSQKIKTVQMAFQGDQDGSGRGLRAVVSTVAFRNNAWHP